MNTVQDFEGVVSSHQLGFWLIDWADDTCLCRQYVASLISMLPGNEPPDSIDSGRQYDFIVAGLTPHTRVTVSTPVEALRNLVLSPVYQWWGLDAQNDGHARAFVVNALRTAPAFNDEPWTLAWWNGYFQNLGAVNQVMTVRTGSPEQ